MKHGNLIADPEHQIHVVLNYKKTYPLILHELSETVHDLVGIIGRHSCRWLVEQKKVRPQNHGYGDLKTLPVALRECADHLILLELEQPQRLEHPGTLKSHSTQCHVYQARAPGCYGGRQLETLADGHVVKELRDLKGFTHA